MANLNYEFACWQQVKNMNGLDSLCLAFHVVEADTQYGLSHTIQLVTTNFLQHNVLLISKKIILTMTTNSGIVQMGALCRESNYNGCHILGDCSTTFCGALVHNLVQSSVLHAWFQIKRVSSHQSRM